MVDSNLHLLKKWFAMFYYFSKCISCREQLNVISIEGIQQIILVIIILVIELKALIICLKPYAIILHTHINIDASHTYAETVSKKGVAGGVEEEH